VGPVGFDVEQQALIWAMWRRGAAIREMERTLGETLPRIRRYLRESGGMPPIPRRRKVGHLTLGEREEISRGIAAGRKIARDQNRPRRFGGGSGNPADLRGDFRRPADGRPHRLHSTRRRTFSVHRCARQDPGRPDRRRAAERPSGTKALAAWPAGHLHNRAARGGTRRATRPLGVDPKTVRRYISQGRLKAVRVGPRLIPTERESLESLGKPVGGAQ
jgi:hypothetical protein